MRDNHVDFIKGWAMITIVFFHMSTGLNLGEVISGIIGNPWNVAIFFVVAGFYVKEDKLAAPIPFLKRKIQTLYVPATIVYIIAVLLHNLFVDIGWYPLGDVHPGNGIPFSYYELNDTLKGCGKALLCAGSGELVMGAMWFLYVLIYAFVGLSILTWILKKVIKDDEDRKHVRLSLLIILGTISCYSTQIVGYTINRVNVTFTAMLLIEVGKYVNQKLKWQYDNWRMFLFCLLTFLHCIIMMRTRLCMAKNQYQDLVFLIIGSCSAIYMWGWLYKKIGYNWFTKSVCYVGRESLYVMMLHIAGLFLCNSLFASLGLFNAESPKGMYTYNLMNNPFLILIYLLSGLVIPLFTISVFRKIRTRLRIFR